MRTNANGEGTTATVEILAALRGRASTMYRSVRIAAVVASCSQRNTSTFAASTPPRRMMFGDMRKLVTLPKPMRRDDWYERNASSGSFLVSSPSLGSALPSN